MIPHEVRLVNKIRWPVIHLPLTDGREADRTSELRKKGYTGRRLGPKQMTTDTAVRVTRMVVQEKGERHSRMGLIQISVCLATYLKFVLYSFVGADSVCRLS